MHTKPSQHIAIIGCGNLAWHLAGALQKSEFSVKVYNHRKSKALDGFKKAGFETSSTLAHIREAHYYFLCVPDEQIERCSLKLMGKPGLAVHCSGATSLQAIRSADKAVLYPLQSFKKEDVIEWRDTFLFLEANTPNNLKKIKSLAAKLSPKIKTLNEDHRLKLHLSAVLVNNFSNALFAAAENILGKTQPPTPFSVLLPLLEKTIKRLQKHSPLNMQTGPAKRNDTRTIEKHKKILAGDKELLAVYKTLSKLIQKQQSHVKL